MTIVFKTPKQVPGGKAQAQTPVGKDEKRALLMADRRIVTVELQAEMNGSPIPRDIEDAIDRGEIGPQEIIAAWEAILGRPLGKHQRGYVVTNHFAQRMMSDKAALADKYCPEVADMILERMCNGEPLQVICRDKFMPHISRFLYWVAHDEQLEERYTRAKECMVEALVLRSIREVFEPRTMANVDVRADGTEEIHTYDNVPRSRLIVDHIKWVASKIIKNTYGPPVAAAANDSNTMVFKLVNAPDLDDRD